MWKPSPSAVQSALSQVLSRKSCPDLAGLPYAWINTSTRSICLWGSLHHLFSTWPFIPSLTKLDGEGGAKWFYKPYYFLSFWSSGAFEEFHKSNSLYNSIWGSFHPFILFSLFLLRLPYISIPLIPFHLSLSALPCADMASFLFSTEKWLIYYSRGSSSSPTAYRCPLNWALNGLHE